MCSVCVCVCVLWLTVGYGWLPPTVCSCMVVLSFTDTVKSVVMACRQQNPAQRPDFTDIFVLLIGRNVDTLVPPPTYLEAAADSSTSDVSKGIPAVKPRQCVTTPAPNPMTATPLASRTAQLMTELTDLIQATAPHPPMYMALQEQLTAKYGADAFDACKARAEKVLMELTPSTPLTRCHQRPTPSAPPVYTPTPAGASLQAETLREQRIIRAAVKLTKQTPTPASQPNSNNPACRNAGNSWHRCSEFCRQPHRIKTPWHIAVVAALGSGTVPTTTESAPQVVRAHPASGSRTIYQKVKMGPIKPAMPGETQPANWVCDGERQACIGCAVQFAFAVRRHHCRICGEIFCDKCSAWKVWLSWTASGGTRACTPCYAKELTKLAEVELVLEKGHRKVAAETAAEARRFVKAEAARRQERREEQKERRKERQRRRDRGERVDCLTS